MPWAGVNVTHILLLERGSSEDEEECFEAAPERDPAGAIVAFSSQVAAEAGQLADELGDGHVSGSITTVIQTTVACHNPVR